VFVAVLRVRVLLLLLDENYCTVLYVLHYVYTTNLKHRTNFIAYHVYHMLRILLDRIHPRSNTMHLEVLTDDSFIQILLRLFITNFNPFYIIPRLHHANAMQESDSSFLRKASCCVLVVLAVSCFCDRRVCGGDG